MHILAISLLFLGGIVVLLGSVGLIRFPDFFSRLHSVSVIETLGAGLILFGLILLCDDWIVAFKLFMIFVLLLFLSPASSHGLAKTARAKMRES